MPKLLSAEDAALLYRHLAAAARHHQPFVQLFSVLEQDPEFFSGKAPVSKVMLEALGDGNSLPDAMARLPQLFSAATVELVRHGEKLGKLPETLEVLAEEQVWMANAGKAAKNATSWPLTLLAIGGIVFIMVNIFVMPSFKSLFSSFGADLPGPTLVLLGISDFIVSYWWVLIVIAAAGGIAVRRKAIPPRVSLFVERMFLAIPFLQNFAVRIFWARLLRWLVLCEREGELFSLAIAHIKDSTRLQVFQGALNQLSDRLASGQTLGKALDMLPPLPRRMALQIQLGEMTGEISNSLGQALDTSQAELDVACARYERGIFLVTYLAIGFTIGFMVIAMYLPIFKMGSAI